LGPSQPSSPQVTIAPTASDEAATVHVSSRGMVSIPVRCAGAAGARCAGTLALASAQPTPAPQPRRPKRRAAAGIALGSAGFSVPAGRTTRVAVKLGRAGARLLSTLPRLRARAHVVARSDTDAGAPATVGLLPDRAPALTIASRVAQLDARDAVTLKVRCAAPKGQRCAGLVALSDHDGSGLVARKVAVAGGRDTTIAMRLQRNDAARLRTAGGLRVRATTTSQIPVGMETSRTSDLVLRPARAN
jgi:hypothetical protein